MMEWNERTRLLLGEEGCRRLADARVAVIGVGGVGAYAAEMLVRAGVGHLLILDSDEVSVSNRNRQLIALSSTVGMPKCEVLRGRLLDINPELDIQTISKYIISDDVDDTVEVPEGSLRVSEALAGERLDYVVDAIDTLGPKISLIKFCLSREIPLVSSMGSGAKFDATKVRVADISKTRECPLAHQLRKRLHRCGIFSGFDAVYSEEKPCRESVVIEESRNKKSQVGTISYLPAVFGCVCAQKVICNISGATSCR